MVESKEYKAKINDEIITFTADSNYFYDKNSEVPFYNCPSELSNINWIENPGYKIIKVFTNHEHSNIRSLVKSLLEDIFIRLKLNFNKDWELEDYHKIVKNDQHHQEVISITREFDPKQFNINKKICSVLEKKHKLRFVENKLAIKEHGQELLIIRINRPSSKDINPAHRDSDLKKWEKCINIWYPLAGDRKLSVLPIIPNSHKIPNNHIKKLPEKANFEGKKYTVNAIVGTKQNFNFIRPRFYVGDVLFFTPFLIHGLAYNRGNTTRISLELRPMVDTS